MAELFLTHFCRIENNNVSLNGKNLFSTERDETFENFASKFYTNLRIDYPKFFKMDNQSKLGLLASEVLNEGGRIFENYQNEEIGIVLNNKNSSLSTDINYSNTLNAHNYFPSPSLFVYTLPNIVSGEICIRHHIKGENAFFLSDNIDSELLYFYIQHLMKYTHTKVCIGGWVDYFENNYNAFLFTVETSSNNGKLFSAELLNKIFYK